MTSALKGKLQGSLCLIIVGTEGVRQVSEANEQFYKTFVSPFVRAVANPWTAAMFEWLHPMRTSRYLLSERFSPWMRGVAELARTIEKSRKPLPPDSPSLVQERAMIGQVSKALEEARKQRDAIEEKAFALLYGAKAAPRSDAESEERRRHGL